MNALVLEGVAASKRAKREECSSSFLTQPSVRSQEEIAVSRSLSMTGEGEERRGGEGEEGERRLMNTLHFHP
jgi:hypothetical protein